MTSESVMATNPPETARNADLIRNATIAVAAFLSLLGAIRYGMHAGDAGRDLRDLGAGGDLPALTSSSASSRTASSSLPGSPSSSHRSRSTPNTGSQWVVASFGAGLFFLAVALAYPAGLGMGDVKLALLIGAALGWPVLTALFLGTLASGLVAGVMLFKEGSSARKRAIPLGPFLAGGAIVVLLFL